MDTLNLKESDKGSEGSGSSDTIKKVENPGSNEPVLIEIGIEVSKEKEIQEQKREIIKLSNGSIIHGFEMAIDILVLYKEDGAVKILTEALPAIKVGLEKTQDEILHDDF